jgi:HK97 family phage portal protein
MSKAQGKNENKSVMVLSKVHTGSRQTALTVDYATVNYTKLENIYKTEQMLFQAVNIISNFAISKGYEFVIDENIKEQIEQREIASEFDSRVNLPKLLTDVVRHLHIYGNAYLEIVFSKTEKDKVVDLVLIDPKTINFKKTGTGEIDLDDQGKIKGYIQKVGTKEVDLEPDQVIHFRINTIADSLTGTGIIEPVTQLIEAKRNIELGLAESVYRHGFPQFHVKLGDKEHQPEGEQVEEESEKYKKINSKSEFVTPYYYDIKVLEAPSLSGGDNYLKYFVNQIVAGTGVPKSILLGSGEDSNRSTSVTHQQNFFLYIAGVQMVISSTLEKFLFTKLLKVEENPVHMQFNSLKAKTDLELAQEREIYLKYGVVTPDEVRQEMGLDPISTPPKDEPQDDVSNVSSGDFFNSSKFLSSKDLMIEEDEDFNEIFMPYAQKYASSDANIMEAPGIFEILGQQIKSRFIKDEHLVMHKINKIFDSIQKKFLKEIDEKYKANLQQLAPKDIKIDADLIKAEEEALATAIFANSKKKHEQGINLGEKFIKKNNPAVKGIGVKSKIDENALNALNLSSTKLAGKVSNDVLRETQKAIATAIKQKKSVAQLKEDIQTVFEKFGGTGGRFNKVGTRAELIARTELQTAFVNGNIQSFKDLKVKTLRMVTLPGACETCLEASPDNQNVPINLSVGILPLHPRCRCGWFANSFSG